MPGPTTAPRSARPWPIDQALQALAHLPEDGDTRELAIDLRLALGGSLYALGEYGRCLALLGEAEALARALDDRARLGRVLAGMASVLRMTGDPDGAIAAGQQALDLAVALGESALQVQASLNLGQVTIPSATSAGRPSCCGGAWRRRTGRLARPVLPCGSGPGRGWRGPWARSGPSPRAGATGRRRSASPRWQAEGTHRSWPTTASATCTSPKGTWSPPSGCWSRAWPSVVPPATGPVAIDRGGPGLAYALQGRLAEGRALLEEAISENIRTGGLQGHSSGSHGSARSVVWRDAARRPGSTPARRSTWPGSTRTRERGVRAAPAWRRPGPRRSPRCRARRSLLPAGPGPGRRTRHAPAAGPLPPRPRHPVRQHRPAAAGPAALTAAIELYRAMDMTFWLPQAEAALAQVEYSAMES